MKKTSILLSSVLCAALLSSAPVYAEAVPDEAEPGFLEENWNYSSLYFSCPDFDIRGGMISWNDETSEWNAEFPTPYIYTVLGGTFSENGEMTLSEDNTGGHGEAYIPGLEEEFEKLRNGLTYAYLAFSCPDFDITNGIVSWNTSTDEWHAEFPTPYMYTTLGGTLTDDGKLELTDDNTGGHGDAYLPGLEDAFEELLSGKRQAPLFFETENSEVTDGVISWDEEELEWNASFSTPEGDVLLEGRYDKDGKLELEDNAMEKQAAENLPHIQNAFLNSLKGFYGDASDEKVVDLNELVAGYPGNADEYNFDDIEEMDDSPLKDKSICILGSSVAFGQASMQNAVGEYLAARFGAELTKETVSGTTLVDADETSYVSRMVSNLDTEADFDLFICQLSTNDATKKLPLGDISDSTEGDDFDTSTITGAMEYIIWYAKTTWNCPVVFFTGSRYESEEYSAMVERLKELADKWEIGILDLWSDDGFNQISEEERALYMSDDIHPTKAGYKMWWGPEQESQLMAYLATIG